jgi:carboxylesterase
MTRHTHLNPAPFYLEGGPTGILLIHGFTGSPPEMRWIGEYLNRNGLTVAAPLLPGHGTTVEDMNRCRWRDWTGCVEGALADLRGRCDRVFVGGLSMGALLTLYLAARHPDLPGVVLYSPATRVADWRILLTPLARFFVRTLPKSEESDLTDPEAERRLWSYEEYPVPAAAELLQLSLWVRRHLRQVTCPLLLVYSTRDLSIHPQSGPFTYEHVASSDKEMLVLHNSGHALTVDSEWEMVAERTLRFITRLGT